ncbi:Mannose-P-dolichol utilization defect 1 protein-like protein [Frankliniella fusca]|uniref:Mannose-P-dolichol utilization defect 1 protein-like protein n=1 Tax=Frankliniella fusca TaxID=407009 RepID=A0AAE1GTG7_9NEOP|nr:Mannose-P-dolichol utilization defect 1 protein-like protein [Frankliniella fusca]
MVRKLAFLGKGQNLALKVAVNWHSKKNANTTIQIYSNYSAGSTGQLSAATVLMLLAGSVARIFTSQQETGDRLLVFTYVVAATLNAITAAQVFYYWNVSSTKQQQQQKKKVKKN